MVETEARHSLRLVRGLMAIGGRGRVSSLASRARFFLKWVIAIIERKDRRKVAIHEARFVITAGQDVNTGTKGGRGVGSRTEVSNNAGNVLSTENLMRIHHNDRNGKADAHMRIDKIHLGSV